jgi:hypothetical protein
MAYFLGKSGRRDRQDWALGVSQAVAAYPAGNDPGQHAAAACSDNQQVSVAGCDGDQDRAGIAALCEGLD